MTPEQWQGLCEAVAAAESRPVAEQRAYLLAKFADDPSLASLAIGMLAELNQDATRVSAAVDAALDDFTSSTRIHPGDMIGGYRVEAEIGAGGMGSVYRARKTGADYDMPVALKVVPVYAKAGAPDLSEIRLLATLSHPNIARLIDGGVHPRVGLYLVTEYVDGLSLREFIDDRQLSAAASLGLFMDICAAVQHAHQQLIVHCDIKPANILVSDGIAKLLDFGIASKVGPEPDDSSETGVTAYSPNYASPEQLRGDSPTTGTDIYSLGLLLWELLTGRPAFQGDKHREAALEERRALDARQRRTIDIELAAIINMACAFDPGNRYASAADLRDDIQNYLGGYPVRPLAGSRWHRLSRFVRRNLAASIATFALLASLVAFSIITTLQATDLRAERDRLEVERSAKAASTAFLATTLQTFDPVTLEKDLSPVPAEFLQQLAVRARSDLEAVPLARAEVLTILGDALHSRSEYDTAIPILMEATDLYQDTREANPANVAIALAKLGTAVSTVGDYDQAATHFEQALALLEQAGERNTIHHARIYRALGARERILGNHDQSRTYLENAVDIFRETAGDSSAETAGIIGSLGYHFLFVGQPDKAIPLLIEAMDVTERSVGSQHLNYGRQMAHLASAYRENGSLDNALAMYPRAIDIIGTAVGTHHSYVINARAEYGRALQRMGEFDAALAEFEGAARSAEVTFGDDHYQWGIQRLNLAILNHQTGALAESAAEYELILETVSQTLPPDNAYRAAALMGLALIDLDKGIADAAREKNESAREAIVNSLGTGHWYFDLNRCIEATALKMLGQDVAGGQLFSDHFDAFRNARPDGDFRVAKIASYWDSPP